VEKIMLSAIEHALASGKASAPHSDPINYIVFQELPEDPTGVLELMHELAAARELEAGMIACINPFTGVVWMLQFSVHPHKELWSIYPQYRPTQGKIFWDDWLKAVKYWMQQCLSP
jgi:hypothetical protein